MELSRCPAAYIDVKTLKAFKLYSHYVGGRFPVAGGVLDQTACGLEVFELLDHYIAATRKG